MSSRTYLVGLPVGITVDDDGTVSATVYLEDAGLALLEQVYDTDEQPSDEQMACDQQAIERAFSDGRISVA